MQKPPPFWTWAMYDWANSAFAAIIVTFVFPVYFKGQVTGSAHDGALLWGALLTISGALIVAAAPFIGMAVDRQPRQGRRFMLGLTLAACGATAILGIAVPDAPVGILALTCLAVVVANTAFELALIVLNGLLPHIAPAGRTGRLSGMAWGLGYLGGIAALACALFFFIGLSGQPGLFGLEREDGTAMKAVCIFTALWFFIFSLPLFLTWQGERTVMNAQTHAPYWPALKQQLARIIASKPLWRFYLGSALIRDGLTTLFAVGAIYASIVVGLNAGQIIIFGIGMNVTAAIGAFAFGFIDDRVGSRITVLASTTALIALSIALLLIRDPWLFVTTALALGLFVGPAQSSLRAWLARVTPPGQEYGAFGFYALSGKAVAVLGPLFYTLALAATGSQVWALATIPAVWCAGIILIHLSDDQHRS